MSKYEYIDSEKNDPFETNLVTQDVCLAGRLKVRVL